jgi:Lon-like protease
MYRRTPPFYITFVLVLITLFAIFAPLPYSIIQPGPAWNLFSGDVHVDGFSDTKVNGKILATAVFATAPATYVNAPMVLEGWIRGLDVVVPRKYLYDPTLSPKLVMEQSNQEMVGSQNDARAAALRYLRTPHSYLRDEYLSSAFPDRQERNKVESSISALSPSSIHISLQGTGGPSAGLAFTLATIVAIAAPDALHGKTVAATGTITSDGTVGKIGGIDQKLEGSYRAGAKYFLAPVGDCQEISHKPRGMTVIPVTNLDDAFMRLATLGSGSIPKCG